MINAETYRLAVKMICDSMDNLDDPCDYCQIVDTEGICMANSDYSGDGSTVPIVEKWLQDHPDKDAEIERMVAEMEDEAK